MQNEIANVDISELVNCIGNTSQQCRDISLPRASRIGLREVKSGVTRTWHLLCNL